MEAPFNFRAALLGVLAATLVAAVVFALWPQIDLAAARLFQAEGGGFVERGGAAAVGRTLGFYLPFVLLAGACLLWLARRAGLAIPAPPGRAVIFLLASMALGPGLLTNVFLKEVSSRPRPVQVQDFGGKAEFRPYWRWDGACARKCSFVSGEASGAFWTLAPALLVPPPARAAAISASVFFGILVGGLRMAYGGHFLSDVVFAGLFTALVVLGVALALLRRR